MTRSMRTARACLAALALTGLLAGLPALLLSAWPWARLPSLTWPHWDTSPWAPPLHQQWVGWLAATWDALRLELGLDGAVLLILVCGGWVCWALLASWTVRDVVSLARHGSRALQHRMPSSGPRGWITALATAAVVASGPVPVAVAASTASSASVTEPHPGGSLPLPHGSEPALPLGSGGHPDPLDPGTRNATSHDEYPRYRVARGDTLWDVAARHLGDPHRWPDIAALNALDDTRLLRPGEVLLLPPDAADLPVAPPVPADARWITVAPGDTLATIAARELGSPQRWYTLFRLNVHRPQPDGRALRDPNMLFPCWRLALPPHAAPSRADHDAPVDDATVQHGSRHSGQKTRRPSAAGPGVDLGPGVYLGLGVAAAASAALVVARSRHRRRHRPGQPGTGDYPVPPTVYRLKLAHLRATEPSLDSADENDTATTNTVTAPSPDPQRVVEIGVRDGQSVHLDLTCTPRLGLVGPGAAGALRALIASLLTMHEHDRLVVHRDLAEDLFGSNVDWPPAVEIVDDLHAAWTPESRSAGTGARAVVVASADAALRDAPHETAVVVLGPCPSGVTLTVDAHSTVTDATPCTTPELVGTRLFTATTAAAHDLVALANDTAPDHEGLPPQSAPPARAASVPVSENTPSDAVGSENILPAPPDHSEPRVPQHNAPAPQHSSPPSGSGAPRDTLQLRVFGPVTASWGQTTDITGDLKPRQRELLAYLALHPDGVLRDTLIADLWHHSPPSRPTNALNTTLSRLRRALSDATDGALVDIIDTSNQHLRLLPETVDVDYWHFSRAEETLRTTHDNNDRLAALEEIVRAYAEIGVGIDGEWITTPRFAAQRTAINAISELARHHITTDAQRTLDLLETGTRIDPYNEHLYRDIMRVQARIGMHDGIQATLELLKTRLRELNLAPESDTIDLANALRRRDAAPARPAR